MRNENHAGAVGRIDPDLFEPIDRDLSGSERIERDSMSAWQHIRRRLMTNRLAMTGLVLMILMVLLAVFAPILSPYDHYTNDLENANRPPSWSHWFGTDDLGRDMFVRTWKGAQVSLFVGVIAALIDLVIGVATAASWAISAAKWTR